MNATVRRLLPVAAVVLFAVLCALRAAASSKVGGDFLRYHRAGRLVSTGRAELLYDAAFLKRAEVYAEERAAEAASGKRKPDPLPEREFKYLPALAVMMAPLGSLPPRTAWILWGGWNGLLVGATFLAAWRIAAQGLPGRWFLVALLPMVHAANDNLNLGQLNPSAIAPATLALLALSRGRETTAGLLAAFGGTVKFIPWFLALFFLLKRRWIAAAAVVVGGLAFAWGLPAVALGPARATALTGTYLEVRAHHYTGAVPEDLPGHSIKSFVYRTLGGVLYRSGSGEDLVEMDVSVARLDPQFLRTLVYALTGLALLGVTALAWGPLRGGDDPRGPPEAALFVVWLLLMSPEARAPHFLYLALPAAALTAALVRAYRERLPRRHVALALGVAGAVLLQSDSSTVFGASLAETMSAWCGLGWAALAWGAALALSLRRPAAA